MRNNIASGQSSVKQHLSNGASTACNRKMSTHKNEFVEFKYWAEKYPEICCAKCLNRFVEKSNCKQGV
jgi:hypothetical protein